MSAQLGAALDVVPLRSTTPVTLSVSLKKRTE